MNNELVTIIIATGIISSGSLIGIVTLAANRTILSRILLALVALSAGTMLSAAMLHLLPESVETLGETLPFQLALASFIAFFLLERFLHWRHCHDKDHLDKHTLGFMNLFGDAIHNFLDGILIAASYASGTGLGIISTLAIALHEIPQEIGDFGVLLHSGYSRKKALIANLLVSFTCVLGGIFGYYGAHTIQQFAAYLVPIAAGGFLYIASSDLIPELKEAKTTKKTLATIFTFFLGVLLMILVKD